MGKRWKKRRRLIAKINEKEEFNGDANYVYVIEPKITFIALDKDVKEVDFDVYRTTITRKKGEYIPIFIFEGIVLTIIVIIIVILIILVYNQKIESNLNEKNYKDYYNYSISIYSFVFNILDIC